jgi:hypothetical protein
LFKTFSTGVILGLILAGAAAHFLPLFDLHREVSLIAVQPNGGNSELFQIHLPADRIVGGRNGMPNRTPANLVWPDLAILERTGVELFKMRNAKDKVVGVASRISASGSDGIPVFEWALYLPARGSMYFPMSTAAAADGMRSGSLRAGTQEFANRRGSLGEVFLPEATDDEQQEAGRIELRAELISTRQNDAGSAAE